VTGIHHPFPDAPAPGKATEVAPGILWMRLPLPMALDHVNVYALDDGTGWTLIDTGMATAQTRAIWPQLLEGPLAGRPVQRVVVTHHHPDHVGLAGWFQSRGATLMMPRTAWLYARMLVLDDQSLPPPETLLFYRRAGLPADALARRAAERPFNFCDVVDPLPQGFAALHDGGSLTMGGRDWTIRFGSGHAPDHATFWSGDLILGGDQLLPGISANIGVYPTEPDADPLTDWLDSCRRFRPLATDAQLVLPGHKLPFTGLPLRLGQMIDNHLGALDRLMGHLTTPHTAADCFLPLFRRDITGPAHGMALVEAVAHLNHLLRQGRVTRDLSSDGAWLWQCIGSQA
jgi:glyoxylase-like metal-dependent hydrolase (beta-lactamase superfamily II)